MDKRWLLPQYFYETQVPDAILGAAYSYAKGMTYNKGGQTLPDLHKKEHLSFLVEYINHELEKVRVSEKMRFEFLKVHLMWCNKRVPNQWHPIHHHPNSYVSGIIYLTTNDARTWFSAPNQWHPHTLRETTINPYHNQTEDSDIIEKIESVAGKMIIFPSHMPHSVDNNKSKSDRYTISFNAFPCV